jgi:hypothetical protein
MNSPRIAAPLAAIAAIALSLAPAFAAPAQDPNGEWQALGPMRVRDMTPFGLTRLDMLPAHAVAATPGTFAVEVNVSHQNTWAISENVADYLEERGIERGEIGATEIAALVALSGEAYLVDGEFGLVDLTLHYRASRHLGVYATIPYYTFGGGFLDSTIEGFHDEAGFSNAGRTFAPRNRFLVVADLPNASLVLEESPENDFGDPVVGIRHVFTPEPGRWHLVIEAAAKLVVDGSDSEASRRLTSSGHHDFGAQFTAQRFFRRNALYASIAVVDFQGPTRGIAKDRFIPSALLGWEGKMTRNANFIVQLSAAESVVQETELDEISAAKIQATLGVQWRRGGHVVRFGITENIANFDNTPDVGLNLSFARIFAGGRKRTN